MENHTHPTDSTKTRNSSDNIIGVIIGTLAGGFVALLYWVLSFDCLYASSDRFADGLIETGIRFIEVIVAFVVAYAIIGGIVAIMASLFAGGFYCLSHQRA